MTNPVQHESPQSRSSDSAFAKLNVKLERLAGRVTSWVGGNWAFASACAVVLVWLATGPLFRYSDTWQLVINTGTTIVTFLMVFLIQRSQNKDSLALQLKLNELVAAVDGASNQLIDVEDLTEDDLHQLHEFYMKLALMAKKDASLRVSHSVEEAGSRHEMKASKSRSGGGKRAHRRT